MHILGIQVLVELQWYWLRQCEIYQDDSSFGFGAERRMVELGLEPGAWPMYTVLKMFFPPHNVGVAQYLILSKCVTDIYRMSEWSLFLDINCKVTLLIVV